MGDHTRFFDALNGGSQEEAHLAGRWRVWWQTIAARRSDLCRQGGHEGVAWAGRSGESSLLRFLPQR